MVLHIHKHIQTYLYIKTDNPKDSQIKHSVISEIPNPIKIENPTNTKPTKLFIKKTFVLESLSLSLMCVCLFLNIYIYIYIYIH